MNEAPDRILAGDWEPGVFGDQPTDDLQGGCVELARGAAVEGWSEYVRADFDVIARWLAGDGALIAELNEAIERELERLEAADRNPTVCDGCNVHQSWEHRCHGNGCPCRWCEPTASTEGEQ